MKSIFVLAAFLLAIPMAVAQQQYQVKVAVKLERVFGINSPTISSPGTRELSFKPKTWMMLEGKMNVQAAPVPKSGYLDKITARFYFMAKNPEGREYILMKKEIDYVNVPVGEECYICVLMSPSSIKRLTGSENVSGSMFDNYGVEIVYDNKVVAAVTHKKKVGWWDISSPSLVPTDSYPLLNKNETPFAIFWYDRYPEIAPARRDAGSNE